MGEGSPRKEVGENCEGGGGGVLCGRVFELGHEQQVGFGFTDGGMPKLGRRNSINQNWQQGNNSNNNDNSYTNKSSRQFLRA